MAFLTRAAGRSTLVVMNVRQRAPAARSEDLGISGDSARFLSANP